MELRDCESRMSQSEPMESYGSLGGTTYVWHAEIFLPFNVVYTADHALSIEAAIARGPKVNNALPTCGGHGSILTA